MLNVENSYMLNVTYVERAYVERWKQLYKWRTRRVVTTLLIILVMF